MLGDFTLVCDWRWSGRGPQKSQPVVMPDGSENGIRNRGTRQRHLPAWQRQKPSQPVELAVRFGEVYGYRTDRAQPAEVRAAVTPKVNADRPIGEWNRMMITTKATA